MIEKLNEFTLQLLNALLLFVSKELR